MAVNHANSNVFDSSCYHDMSSCLIEESLTSCPIHVVSSCHDQSHEVTQLDSCHDDSAAGKLSKSDWYYLVEILESWRVYNPRAVIKRYGALNCWEAMVRTKDFTPRVPGAYFTKVVRQLTGMNGKLQELKIQQEKSVSLMEAFNDYKVAQKWLCSLTDKDLENPETVINRDKLMRKFNFG